VQNQTPLETFSTTNHVSFSVAVYNIERCTMSILLQHLLHDEIRCAIFWRA